MTESQGYLVAEPYKEIDRLRARIAELEAKYENPAQIGYGYHLQRIDETIRGCAQVADRLGAHGVADEIRASIGTTLVST